MIESGYPQVGFHPDVWQGIFAPAGTPTPIVEKLNTEINAVLKTPEVEQACVRLGVDRDHVDVGAANSRPSSPRKSKKWPPIIKAIGVKAQ